MSNRPKRERVSSSSLSLIGIPPKFHSATLSDFETFGNSGLKKVKSFMIEYAQSLCDKELKDIGGIFLYGSNGVGKTMLSCLILKQAYICRYSARRATFVEYMTKYTSEWSARNTDEREAAEDALYSQYKAVEFLVLEEVGKEIDSKVAAPILEDLLRYREDKGFVTIMCSNLSPKAIKERYGESVYSLMQGNMTPIKIEGSDNRKEYFKRKESQEE